MTDFASEGETDRLRRATAPLEAAGARLDRWASETWPELSRSRLKALIEAGHLRLDGAVLDNPSAKVKAGGTYALDEPDPIPAAPSPEDLPLDVLFEDAHLIVLDKRAGMPSHPAVGHSSDTLVNALLHHCAGELSGIGGVERPGIVHRLDKDTSGVMVAAKTDAAHQGLSKLFAAHDLERVYLAACRTAPNPRAGRIETRLGRSDGDRKKQIVLADDSPRGKLAITDYETVRTFGQEPDAPAGTPAASLVACRLHTGRTHQIRVHLAHLGCPVLGDPMYGKQRAWRRLQTAAGEVLEDFNRQALHASVLGFEHPITGETMRFETELPPDMARLIEVLEGL